MRTLYPEIEPYQTFFLETGTDHSVYVELSGNPDGMPVVFLHGGPCSGTRAEHRRFFDPERFLIILFDQRGCGQSLPYGELANNTTQDLIDDMECIRERLAINQWLLFGGSWGGALALLYAQQHREQVSSMIIRGVFLARQQDLDWFAKNGANHIYPEQWRQLLDSLSAESGQGLVEGLCDALCGDDQSAMLKAAQGWSDWGGRVSLGNDFQASTDPDESPDKLVLRVRMELCYAKEKYFIAENQILDNCAKLNDIPTMIIHGRYDLVCPIAAGYQLKQALGHAEFHVLPTAGHVAKGEEMIDALVTATDNMVDKLSL